MKLLSLLSYWGVSALSKGIQFINWRSQSHVAEALPDGRIVEMWKGGFRFIDNPWEGHSKRTRVFIHDIYRLDESRVGNIIDFYEWCDRKELRYHVGGLFRFLTRTDPRRFRNATCKTVSLDYITSFVCSSLIAFAHCRFERPLITQHWWRVYPGLLVDSTRVGPGREIFRGDGWPLPVEEEPEAAAPEGMVGVPAV